MRLRTYMLVMVGIRGTPTKANATFDFGAGDEWDRHVKANAIAIKTATIVMYDRWSDK